MYFNFGLKSFLSMAMRLMGYLQVIFFIVFLLSNSYSLIKLCEIHLTFREVFLNMDI